MNDKTIYNATKTLSETLPNYSGYFKSENRKTSASAFTSGIKQKMGPISEVAVTLRERFAKVKKPEILEFFESISSFSGQFVYKHKLDNYESTFFITTYLNRDEAENLSQVELDLLTHLDQFLLAIMGENRHEFLQEIEVGIPSLREIFGEFDSYFSKRAELIKKSSVRHNEITQRLKTVDNHLGKHNTTRPISEITRKLEDRYAGVPIIHIKLLEIFHSHLDSYQKIAESSNEINQSVVDYFNEYLKIIDNAKFIQETAPDEDGLKLKELLMLSDNIEEYADKIFQQEAPQPKAVKKKSSSLFAIYAAVALIAITAAVYFFFLK